MGLLIKLNKLIINKKIRASTLIETLVGTVIIVVLFIIASMVLNNVFKNVMHNNTLKIDNQIYKLQYLEQHQQIKLPYDEDFEGWEIVMSEKINQFNKKIRIEATHNLTHKTRIVEYGY